MFKIKLLKNKKATAEIVGTALFLVILFFFFTNVFLWHDRATREMDQVTADKMNSAVKMETTVGGGQPAYDANGHTISEQSVSGSYQLTYDSTFTTTINSPQKMRLIAGVSLNVHASFDDPDYEGCGIVISYSQSGTFTDRDWVDTGLRVISGFRWLNITYSSPKNYIDPTGQVRIEIVDTIRGSGGIWGASPDSKKGTLYIDYIEVTPQPVALKVTNLGGMGMSLSRLWITETTNPNSDHIYADIEPLGVDGTIPAGAQKIIVLSDTTVFSGESLAVAMDGNNIKVQYVPPAGQTVTFKVLTKNGNTAACSYSFPSD